MNLIEGVAVVDPHDKKFETPASCLVPLTEYTRPFELVPSPHSLLMNIEA